MMAAAGGFTDCVKELLYAGAKPALVDENGKTAEQLARESGHKELAELIRRGGDEEEEEGGDDGGEEGPDDETSTQRNRRKKRELAALESRGALKSTAEAEAAAAAAASAAAAAAAAATAGPPVWPEVAKALESGAKEIILQRPDSRAGLPPGQVVDPALWRCVSANLLTLCIAPAVEGGPPPLTRLPDGLGALRGLRTLTLARNGLEALPDTLCSLGGLRTLDCAFNALEALPDGLSALTELEALSVEGNCLRSLAPLAGLANLVSLNCDGNMIASLAPAALADKPRLVLLSARGNAICDIPAEIEKCALLQSLLLKGNTICEVRALPAACPAAFLAALTPAPSAFHPAAS